MHYNIAAGVWKSYVKVSISVSERVMRKEKIIRIFFSKLSLNMQEACLFKAGLQAIYLSWVAVIVWVVD